MFYMTPQTLMNDLKTDNCNPSDIVLLVIGMSITVLVVSDSAQAHCYTDEAHKGTGDYAYAQVIRYMMAKNPHFRVLALTATPGGNPEAVQAIVDSLHISHIEIRDEQSLDLAPYMHKKHVKQHVIEMTEDVAKVRDMLSEAMEVSHSCRNTYIAAGVDYHVCTANDHKAVKCADSAREAEPCLLTPLQLYRGLAEAARPEEWWCTVGVWNAFQAWLACPEHGLSGKCNWHLCIVSI